MLVAVQYRQKEDSRPGGVQRISKDTDERQEIGGSRSAAPKNKKKGERRVEMASLQGYHPQNPYAIVKRSRFLYNYPGMS
jgi:hypothetical protein